MADPDVIVEDAPEDVEGMQTGDITAEENEAATGLEDIEPTTVERTGFIDYLRSPIVQLDVGSGDNEQASLYAHQALIVQSPFLAAEVEGLTAKSRRIALPNDDLHACAAVLEYLYKGDYFPSITSSSDLEYDSSLPAPDDAGIGLLRHARVYTLAKRFGLPALAQLAHKKIHMTESTAKGEIAYARFVYSETGPDDESIRKPVASFWATRSHVLRHEAEHEFRRMCLEYPQFGFDVLNLVLDAQEKRSHRAEGASSSGSVRKRQRVG